MELFTLQILLVSKLVENKGQLDGVPANPRTIRDVRLEALQKSLEDNPEMLSLRELIVFPLDKKYVVLGGNMRLRACKKLKRKDVPCKILHADTPLEDLRAYVIKDNNGFGEWDNDVLKVDWNEGELLDFGLEMKLPTFEPETAADGESGLPEELQGRDVSPDDLEKYAGDDETACERVILVFRPEQKKAVEKMLGFAIEKVIYSFDEIKQGSG